MIAKTIQIAVPFVWFGAVAAISFMEAPLKFRAPGITLALGLGIGQLVFFALNKIEIFLAAMFALSLLGTRAIGRTAAVVSGLIGLILLLETVWLLPVLDVRAEQVIRGETPPFSNLHVVYIVFDALKLVLLMALGIIVVRHRIADGGG